MDEHLSTILLSNGSIRDLLSVSLEIFHNPLSVIGLDFAPVASAGTEHIPEKYHMYSEDGLNIEYVNALVRMRLIQKCRRPLTLYSTRDTSQD